MRATSPKAMATGPRPTAATSERPSSADIRADIRAGVPRKVRRPAGARRRGAPGAATGILIDRLGVTAVFVVLGLIMAVADGAWLIAGTRIRIFADSAGYDGARSVRGRCEPVADHRPHLQRASSALRGAAMSD
ncbi:hypothetical protein ACIBCT_40240 [Streptosporangium sp. NPDC050855]|uniref:hypothetical protein n=1 Tax=Streptosporangium sp. NPDC050855 TaxID=3366194 RepID=UPI0037BD0FF4